ncbi:MAG: general stress protein CsbD [Bacteroidales bacterium]|nr:general stress protein CsbD [Bacteroidales bacterium]
MKYEMNWNELKKKLKQKYPQLTTIDLLIVEGEEEDMLRMVEYKLGKTQNEMKEIIALL